MVRKIFVSALTKDNFSTFEASSGFIFCQVVASSLQ